MTRLLSRRWSRYIASLLILAVIFAIARIALSNRAAIQMIDQRRVSYAATATFVALPTTPVPQSSPTQIATAAITAVIPTVQDLAILPTPTATIGPGTAIPTQALLLPEQQEYELVNFLVLGSDQRSPTRAYRTDVILIVSVNWSTQTLNLLSVPRDLYVYVPGWGMDRINTAELHQTQTNHTNHRLGLLAEAVEYNLGIRIDHLARIDFDGFETVVDLFDGVTIPIDCPVSGYQPSADGSGWVPFTMEPGLQHLDGNMTLWYVRQRMDSSDFDRNRRQQIVLRALWRKVATSNLAIQLPDLWNSLTQYVETDLTLDQALMYVPMIMNLNPAKIESHFLGLDEVNLGQSPSGASILVVDPVPFARTLRHFLTPPVDSQLGSENARIEIINGSSIPNAEYLVAAQLEWAGVQAVVSSTSGQPGTPRTQLYDYTGQVKGSSIDAIRQTLQLTQSDVLLAAADPGKTVDFTVVIGENYQSCTTSAWVAFPQPE